MKKPAKRAGRSGAMPIQPTHAQRVKARQMVNRATLRRVFVAECNLLGLPFTKKNVPCGAFMTLCRYMERIAQDNVRAFAQKAMTQELPE
jgi:hypothetical protein